MTELDTHANMAVVRSQATAFHTSRTAEARAFYYDELQNLESLPILDDALAYDFPKTLKTYLLIVKNALHILSMKHNLAPPFIMRETGLELNDVPRIHIRDEVTQKPLNYVTSSWS